MESLDFDAIVVGAGLAGLTAAHRLRERGFERVVVLERGESVGGCVRTVCEGGRLFETGPNSLRGHCPAISSLACDVGVAGTKITASPDASERWIWAQGERHLAPSGPKDLLKTKLLTTRGRLRLLSEPFRARWKRPVAESTVAAFLGDRLGPEAFEAFGAPVTTGIFAGEPEDIGVEAFGPIGLAAEAGGLMRGMGRIRAAGGGSGMWTFRDGLGALTDALAARLDVRFGVEVAAWSQAGTTFSVQCKDGATFTTSRLVLATPAAVTGALIGEKVLTELRCASVVSASLAMALTDFRDPPTGFGMLVSRQSPLAPLLGLVLASRIFAGRAPEGELVASAICGGTRHPEAIGESDETLREKITLALQKAFGFRGEFKSFQLQRWSKAIPQVPPGHSERVRTILAGLPAGVALAGNGLGGVSLEQVAVSGLAAADRVSAR